MHCESSVFNCVLIQNPRVGEISVIPKYVSSTVVKNFQISHQISLCFYSPQIPKSYHHPHGRKSTRKGCGDGRFWVEWMFMTLHSPTFPTLFQASIWLISSQLLFFFRSLKQPNQFKLLKAQQSYTTLTQPLSACCLVSILVCVCCLSEVWTLQRRQKCAGQFRAFIQWSRWAAKHAEVWDIPTQNLSVAFHFLPCFEFLRFTFPPFFVLVLNRSLSKMPWAHIDQSDPFGLDKKANALFFSLDSLSSAV